jgi:hypothetical protein
MNIKFSFLALWLAVVASYVNASSLCTVVANGGNHAAPNPVTIFKYPSFSPSDLSTLTVIENAQISGTQLQLTQEAPTGGLTSYVWTTERQRVADGFQTTFEFQVTPNTPNAGDGFTFFIQNYRISDLNGGSGSNLGSFGIPNSIGVTVDLCVDRPNACTIQEVGLKLTNGSFGITSFPVANVTNLGLSTSNQPFTMVVFYEGRLFGSSAKLSVTLNDQLLFTETVGDLAASLFDGRFAYFGFTASTSYLQTASIFVNSWDMIVMPSDSEVLHLNPTTPFSFPFGTTAAFVVQRLTSCQTDVTINDHANITATLSQELTSGFNINQLYTLNGNVTNNLDGTYTVTFNLPNFIIATWDLSILVNDVEPTGLPYIGGVLSTKPVPSGGSLPIWALILLLVLILLIILVLSYVVYRLYRYRKKLRENAEFIEAGKKQAELDRLEDGTSYVANPMVGTIDDLKTQLSKNEEELEQLRRRGMLGDDQNFTIEQLQKQRDALLEEMNRLKREEQEEELKKSKSASNVVAGTRAKKEFGREQI